MTASLEPMRHAVFNLEAGNWAALLGEVAIVPPTVRPGVSNQRHEQLALARFRSGRNQEIQGCLKNGSNEIVDGC